MPVCACVCAQVFDEALIELVETHRPTQHLGTRGETGTHACLYACFDAAPLHSNSDAAHEAPSLTQRACTCAGTQRSVNRAPKKRTPDDVVVLYVNVWR